MKNFTILLFIFFNFCCAKKDSSNHTPNNTIKSSNEMMSKNSQYIGFVDKFDFSKENEAYIELYYLKDQSNDDEYNKIINLADSLIYQDDDYSYSRHQFPDNLTPKYFDLRGLSELKIYDKNNNFYCDAEFFRVEHLDQNISSSFIAVYKTTKKLNSEGYFGISNFEGTFDKGKYTISKDSVLSKNILNKLNEQKPYSGFDDNGTHIHFSNNDTIVSVVNSENYAYVVLTSKRDFKILYKSSNLENIIDLIVIPMPNYKLPHILTRNVKPETDVMWDNLLIYNGAKYEISDSQRIE